MNTNNLFKKIVVFIIGLFIMALGVALSVKAKLGVSPISCIPYVYSLKYPITMGQATILFNVLFIILQVAVQRRNYNPIQLVQLPVVFVFGFFTDFTLYLTSGIVVSNYILQVLLCLLSCIVLAFGVFLEVKAGITYLPGEGLAMAISKTYGIEFGKAKIGLDSSMVVTGIVSAILLLSYLVGIREGTIVAAILVGFIARLYGKKLSKLTAWIQNESFGKSEDKVENASDGKKLVITISREYGSGGHEIGEIVARKLGLSFYDKNLIKLTAEEGNFTAEYIEKNEQKLASTLLHDLYEQNYAYVNEQRPPLDALFLVQSKIIREICEKESCVIVGRCANFILKENSKCFNVFIHANTEYRRERIIHEYGMEASKTTKELEKMDKGRANYSLYYTGKSWNDAKNYHLTLDSSEYGIENTADLIIEAVKKFEILGK